MAGNALIQNNGGFRRHEHGAAVSHRDVLIIDVDADYGVGTQLLRFLGHFPEAIKQWSLISLREKPVKIGDEVVRHARCVAFRMAEVAVPKKLFHEILRPIAELRPQHHQRLRETPDGHAFKSNR